jgi:hypothetical protein
MRRPLLLGLFALLLTVAACGGGEGERAASKAERPRLENVAGIDAFAARVDAAKGKPRLILIFSPT